MGKFVNFFCLDLNRGKFIQFSNLIAKQIQYLKLDVLFLQ